MGRTRHTDSLTPDFTCILVTVARKENEIMLADEGLERPILASLIWAPIQPLELGEFELFGEEKGTVGETNSNIH